MNKCIKWVLAARPKTLPAAIIPVSVGGALAYSVDGYLFVPWFICLVFAILIQIGTNFANDYYDYLKGADDDRRLGPSRAVASGWIAPKEMMIGMVMTFGIAFAVGCLLVPFGGWWLILVGALSIICGVAYTGGPYPLGYNGWGDVFVFVFFGWVATGITFFVQTGTFFVQIGVIPAQISILLAGAVPGALATNLLVVNNVRDAPLDAEAGKRTLVARLGRKFGLMEYAVMSFLAFSIPVCFAIFGNLTGCYLVILCLPVFIMTFIQLKSAGNRDAYNAVLGKTALLLVLTGVAFSLGLMI